MLATHLCNLTNLRPRNHTIKGYSKRLEATPIAVSNPLECLPIICSSSIEWIGLRENVNRKAPYFMGKSLVSGSVPNKTNPFSIRNNGDLRCLYTENIYHTLYTYTTDFYILMIYHTLYTIDYIPYIISSIIHYIPYNISIFFVPIYIRYYHWPIHWSIEFPRFLQVAGHGQEMLVVALKAHDISMPHWAPGRAGPRFYIMPREA